MACAWNVHVHVHDGSATTRAPNADYSRPAPSGAPAQARAAANGASTQGTTLPIRPPLPHHRTRRSPRRLLSPDGRAATPGSLATSRPNGAADPSPAHGVRGAAPPVPGPRATSHGCRWERRPICEGYSRRRPFGGQRAKGDALRHVPEERLPRLERDDARGHVAAAPRPCPSGAPCARGHGHGAWAWASHGAWHGHGAWGWARSVGIPTCTCCSSMRMPICAPASACTPPSTSAASSAAQLVIDVWDDDRNRLTGKTVGDKDDFVGSLRLNLRGCVRGGDGSSKPAPQWVPLRPRGLHGGGGELLLMVTHAPFQRPSLP